MDRYYTPRACATASPSPRITFHGRSDLDLRSTLELVELINDEDALVSHRRAQRRRDRSPRRSTASSSGSQRGGRLVYVGAGSSGRLALVDAAECGPTFGVPPEQVIALVAGGASRWRSRTRQPRTTALQAPPTSPTRAWRSAMPSCCSPQAARRPTWSARSRSARMPARLTVARRLHGRVGARAARRPRGRRRRRARGDRGLDADEGRHRPEARAEHDLDRHDDPARHDLREPDGRRRREQREAPGPGPARRRDRDRRRRRTRSTRRSTAADGDAKVAIVSLLSGLDADDARRRLAAADGASGARSTHETGAMRLGVEAAIVDGVLLPGDVEIEDGTHRCRRARAGAAAASRSPASSTCR